MKGVTRGERVTFTEWRDGKTGRDGAGVEVGTVLDRGPGSGEWWCSSGAGVVLVKARSMTPVSAQGGPR